MEGNGLEGNIRLGPQKDFGKGLERRVEEGIRSRANTWMGTLGFQEDQRHSGQWKAPTRYLSVGSVWNLGSQRRNREWQGGSKGVIKGIFVQQRIAQK
jgi:hypothetical protein